MITNDLKGLLIIIPILHMQKLVIRGMYRPAPRLHSGTWTQIYLKNCVIRCIFFLLAT